MDKKEKITTVLDYLNHRMSVMNQVETDKVKKFLRMTILLSRRWWNGISTMFGLTLNIL